MFRFSSQSIVPTKFVFGVGNFGVLFDSVPTTGENGASVLANDGGVSGQHVRLRIVDVAPTITSLFVYEDGSFISDGYGDWTYYDSKDGVENAELSTVTINPLVSSYDISIADALPSIQSSIGLVIGVPESDLSIITTLPALTSAIQMVNVVPEYTISIATSLPSLQSVMGVTYSEVSQGFSIVDILPALQSSITVTNVVPEYTLSIADMLPAMTSSISLINGDIITYVNPKNLVTLKSKSRFVQLR